MESLFSLPVDVGARSALLPIETRLPPEIWMTIFRFATQSSRFFDARWEYGVVTSFDNARAGVRDASKSFDISLDTKKAILLVCRDWRRLSSELIYQRIYIRRLTQLKPLVHTLEESHAKAVSDKSRSLGWWVTHIKLSTMDYDGGDLFPENSSPTAYAKRLLACCPRLQVFIDAAPYGFDERPRNVLSAIAPISPLSSHVNIRSIEWVYGGPTLGDLAATPQVASSIRSLRCSTVHDQHPSVGPGKLSLPNLAALDLFLAPQSHTHWRLLAAICSLPSLTHLTIRTPACVGTVLGAEALQSLETFLAVYGPQLAHLDLAINPGDTPPSTHHHPGEEAAHMFSVPPILALCPNITELVISARWLASHDRIASPNSTVTPFSVPRHDTIERIGLRDTSPRAESFSATYSHRPCQSCTRSCLFNLASTLTTAPGRGEYAGQHGSSADGIDFVMSHRHCTIDRHLRALLYGFVPLSEIAAASELPPFMAAASPVSGYGRRFPLLQSIQLLDSEQDMFEFVGDRAKCDQWRTCWCTPRVMRVEASFWAEWTERCSERGVDLLDRSGNRVPHCGPGIRDGSCGPSHNEELNGDVKDVQKEWARQHVDLEEELSSSMIEVTTSWSSGGLPFYPTTKSLSVTPFLLDHVTGWFSEKGIVDITRGVTDTLRNTFKIILHVVTTPI